MTGSITNQDLMRKPESLKELFIIQKAALGFLLDLLETESDHGTSGDYITRADHHELVIGRPSKSLGGMGMAVTHYTTNGTFVIRHEHVRGGQLTK